MAMFSKAMNGPYPTRCRPSLMCDCTLIAHIYQRFFESSSSIKPLKHWCRASFGCVQFWPIPRTPKPSIWVRVLVPLPILKNNNDVEKCRSHAGFGTFLFFRTMPYRWVALQWICPNLSYFTQIFTSGCTQLHTSSMHYHEYVAHTLARLSVHS